MLSLGRDTLGFSLLTYAQTVHKGGVAARCKH